MNWGDRAKRVLAQNGSTGTNSKRPSAFIEGVYPTHISRGEGCYLYDVEGRKYIDYVSGLGTNLLGFNHPKVTEAVIAQAQKGASFSLPHYLEIEVAELLQEMVPCAERMRFLKTGNEATLAAVRIARTLSKWKEVGSDKEYNLHAVDVDGYHGHGDLWTSMTPPALGISENFKIYPYSRILDAEYDAVSIIGIVEPIKTVPDKEWLEKIRTHTKCLILDEIVTGFRVPKWTVASWWEIQPDLICLGKAIANGYPLSVVGGKESVMNCGEYFISSTFSGEAVSLAAAKATLTELKARKNDDLFYYANRFQDKLNKVCEEIGVNWVGYGTRSQMNFYESDNAVLFAQEMCDAGVLFGRAMFYSYAHLDANIDDYTLSLASDAVGKIRRGEVKLEGKPPQSTFKR